MRPKPEVIDRIGVVCQSHMQDMWSAIDVKLISISVQLVDALASDTRYHAKCSLFETPEAQHQKLNTSLAFKVHD